MNAIGKNRLARESSPYLLQHADNPVDWFPWCDEAFETARELDRPVMLSIGYSACHWCHVMARESFEDLPTAEVLNSRFVSVKVDREERPDLDRIYQVAHQILAQRPGGWPLTMFLTPDDRLPFFGGTYFPRDARHGLPAFRDLLLRIARFYAEHGGELRGQNRRLENVLRQLERPSAPAGDPLDASPLTDARSRMQHSFDPRHGGFGDPPKFPQSPALEGLLRQWYRSMQIGQPDSGTLQMVELTLRRMAEGGVFDQIGGGFFRYSVDERWSIPHFEKMLYDNGPLLALNAELDAVTGDALFRDTAVAIADWALREMRDEAGGFCASLDADADGREGGSYAWTPDEIAGLLQPQEQAVVSARFGLDRRPNFGARWHLRVQRDLAHTATQAGVEERRVPELLRSARQKLLAARERRPRPARDDKILAGWNGQMVRGLAIAARHLDRPDLAEAATATVDFIEREMFRNGRLLASWKDGRARFPAYLDDHAYLIDGLLELLQVRWRRSDLDLALRLAETLLDLFRDTDHGGFYFTADDHEELIYRPRPFTDDSLPAGNGVAARVFGRLGHMLGEPLYLEAQEQTLRAAHESLREVPQAHYALLMALDEHLNPPTTVVLRGERPELEPWHARAVRGFHPDRLVLSIPADETGLPGLLAERSPRGQLTAWICEGMTCQAPLVDDPEALRRSLGVGA
ncbi:MAG TPA: thioredoxin domain-containing protein [Gammaproteobacteria bacterium]|nr:thioredoxin domain-containing protein [Gammaproteobacteria bacterium]